MSLQHILGDGKTFVLHPSLARLFSAYLEPWEFRERLVETFVPVHFRSCSELTLQDSYLAFSIGDLTDILAQGACRRHAIGSNKSVARIIWRSPIHTHDWYPRRLRGLNRDAGGSGSSRNIDQCFYPAGN